MQNHAGFTSELKFVISGEAAAAVRQWAREELVADPHAVGAGDGYETTTLYFDTDDFDLFFRRGSYARAKYRVRSYNSGAIFLERKMKARDVVRKRRSYVAPADLVLIDDAGIEWPGRWFARRLQRRRLKPVCQIRYSRTALVGASLRLTIDQHLAAVAIDTIAFTSDPGTEVLPGAAILELKYRTELPVLFERLIEEFRLEPRPISKYRLAVRTLGLASEGEGTLVA